MDTFLQDVRYGLRGIRKSPGFAAVVILTLALGIGANTAIFSVVDSVLLHAAPYPNGDRMVWLGESSTKAPGISVTWLNYQAWRSGNHTFQDLAIYEGSRLTMTGRGDPVLTAAGLVSNNFFRLLGAQPVLGRSFNEAEDRAGAERTVVLAHAFWNAKLGGDSRVLGETLTLNGKPYRVIGIAPPQLQFFGNGVDYYLPIGVFEGATTQRNRHGSMRAIGILKPQVRLADATADLDRIMTNLARSDPGPETDHRAYGAFLAEHSTSAIRPTLLILMGAVGLVLLLACANVTSLVLARGTARAGEIAIRAAIGAGRMRIVRQLLTENLVLAAAGGGTGVLLAIGLVRVLAAAGPRDIPRLAQAALNPQVLLFASAITLITGLLVGLAPVWTAGRLDLATAVKVVSRTATGAKRGQTLRSLLVTAEIAITMMLAFASGLLVRSLMQAQNGNSGFAADHVLALELVLPSSTYRTPQATENFFQQLTGDLRGVPGVASIGSVFCPPAAGDCRDWFYSIADRPAPPRSEVPVALVNAADPAYFNTMRIPLREGRTFADSDTAAAPPVAIVNEAFARRWWPQESAVGHRIKMGGPYLEGGNLEIVGVAGNVSQMGLDSTADAEIFLPRAQDGANAMFLMIRTAQDPGQLVAAVRRAVFGIDRNLPIRSLSPFEQSLAASLARRRFGTVLLALFAGLAMLLAAIGIWGLLNYWVAVREGDIAIRMILGARTGTIVRWAGGQALRLTAAGVALGACGSWASSRWMASLVFGVSARSVSMLLLTAAAVSALAIFSAAAPVWRATRIDSGRKLREL